MTTTIVPMRTTRTTTITVTMTTIVCSRTILRSMSYARMIKPRSWSKLRKVKVEARANGQDLAGHVCLMLYCCL